MIYKKRSFLLLTALFMPIAPLLWSQTDEEEEDSFILHEFIVTGPVSGYLSSVSNSATRLAGATVGGAQDIRYFRDQVRLGNIPHPNVLTIEGLLSEHDLPLENAAQCEQDFCVGGEAMVVDLVGQENSRYLAQLGLTSGIDLNTWQRQPLNLIAVIDKSGSMSGRPIDLVKKSLIAAVSHLKEKDQISIVLYGDEVHTHLEPTPLTQGNRPRILKAISEIHSAGATYMEAGLKAGYELAEMSAPKVDGQTRLMLFTDERPNVGKTDPGSFMGMAYAGSKAGYGLTTIGVGVQFGAELATKISNVRGGNLFYFANEIEMKKLFEEEFETIVTQLATDMDLIVRPATGLEFKGVYGIPGEALEWVDKDSLKLSIATIFLSVSKGGIFFAFGPVKNDLPAVRIAEGDPVATAELSYRNIQTGLMESASASFPLRNPDQAATGLRRGALLVDQYLALKRAGIEHYSKNDQHAAFHAIHQVTNRFRKQEDPALEPELELLTKLESTLALLSGNTGETDLPKKIKSQIPSELIGIWRIVKTEAQLSEEIDSVWAFWPTGGVSYFLNEDGFDELYSEYTYKKTTGQRSFILDLIEPEDDWGIKTIPIVWKYRLKRDRLTLEVAGEKITLVRSELRLNPEQIDLDPITNLPKR